jgi:hypothetical protein
MIKYITSAQLSLAQKSFYYKAHDHLEETVFLSSPGPEFLNRRAYKLCKLCGQLTALEIDQQLDTEINQVLEKKLSSSHS